MKVLLFLKEEENSSADKIKPFLEKEGISVETFYFKTTKEESVFNNLSALLVRPVFGEKDIELPEFVTHILIISPLERYCFDFLAGFACGSSVPILVCGESAISAIPSQGAFLFTTFLTVESLQKHFENESKSYKKQEEARKIINAQEALLRMGIPFTREALVQCAAVGEIQELSLFLTAGFSPDTRDMNGVPLLNIAARKGNLKTLQFLISAGAQLNLPSEDRGSTALIDGVMSKQRDIVNELINAGAALDMKSKDGQTALVVAVGAGDEKIVLALLKAGADPDISDSMGASARKYAQLFHKGSFVSFFDTYAPVKEAQA